MHRMRLDGWIAGWLLKRLGDWTLDIYTVSVCAPRAAHRYCTPGSHELLCPLNRCSSCGAAYTRIGTSGGWAQVEAPSIHVTDGYLEFGLHTRASVENSANFTHPDSVEQVRL